MQVKNEWSYASTIWFHGVDTHITFDRFQLRLPSRHFVYYTFTTAKHR
jgi:hypothetical protein